MRVVTTSAPGRCELVGNPSDMYGGSVLSCTVCERAECRIVLNSSAFVLHNDGLSAKISSSRDLELRGDTLDICRAALQYLGIEPATTCYEITLNTSIPMRAGLAGSTAMLAALVGALDACLDLRLNGYQIAETIRKIEAGVMKITCGFQDQHMAVFGGLNYMCFAGKESLRQLPEEPLATIEPLAGLVTSLPIILAHTGVQHHSGTVHSTPRERWLAGDPLVRSHYRLIGELAQHAKQALLMSNWLALGELMNENQRLTRELGGSGPENDRLVQAALDAGAWGAKLAGAGGGGTVLALAENTAAIGDAMMAAGADRLLTPAPAPGLTVTRA